ncbi:MAG TPA: hypothetical protein VGI58_04330 [Streptosporangiaceae bacterium]|jgi:hypothetical protein
MWLDHPRERRLVVLCGVLGPLMLAAYFAVPLFVSPLGRLLYAAHPGTAAVVDIGRRYHELLEVGAWLQATGALLAVIFFLALAEGAGPRTLAAKLTLVGSAVLLAVVLAEVVFTLTWVSAAVNRQEASARASFDLMATFIRVFPIIPAPVIYLSVGVLLLGTTVLPRLFAYLALILSVAFAVAGLIGALLPGAAAATAGLAGLQILWLIAAAISLRTVHARGSGAHSAE